MTRSFARFIAAALLASAATASVAETVYRCGNVYSQSPCATGQALEVSDARGEAQRAEARRLAVAEQGLGDSMERRRLAAEARLKPALATNLGPATPRVTADKPKPKARKRRAAKATWADEVVAVDPSTRKPRRGS
jgi:hypothetical protein